MHSQDDDFKLGRGDNPFLLDLPAAVAIDHLAPDVLLLRWIIQFADMERLQLSLRFGWTRSLTDNA